jgi:hypothetical protein
MKKEPTINCFMRSLTYSCYTFFLALAFSCQLYSQDIYINLNNVRQGIDGAGFCHEGDRQNGNYYVINTAIQQMLDNNMTLFRDMFPNKTWEPSKGTFNYNDQRVINSFLRLKEMQNRGIKTILGIWDVPNWLVSNPSVGTNRKINNFDDFAYFITSFLVHGKNTYGLTVDYIDVNETRTSGINISMTAQEYITLIQKCQSQFTANGLSTKMNLGSVLLWDIQYCKDIYNAVNGLSVAGHPSWHTYKGGSTSGREPISYWEGWGAWQQTINRNLWGTETDYDDRYWENPARLTWTGIEEMAVMYYRNYYVARMSTSAGWFWHPEWPSNNVHTAYMKNFEPGGQVVETSQPNGDVMTVAYKHTAKSKFVIQVLNQGSSARTVNFFGVPNNKPLTLVRTSEAGDRNTTVGTYTPNGTTLNITLQANSFNTFYGELETTTPSGPNLAYNRPVFTTSNENSTNTGAKAVDADGNTRWSSSYANNQSIVVDLGANYNVNRVRLAWEAAYAKDYQIQFSTNNTTWTTVREFWGKTSAAADNQTGLSGVARYVKVYCINRATTYGFSLYEFEIYGTAAGARIAITDPGSITSRKQETKPELSAGQSLQVFPNPVRSEVTIQLPVTWQGSNQLTIVNSDGKVVLRRKVTGARHTLPLVSLPAGLYTLKISDGSRQVTHKIIKE